MNMYFKVVVSGDIVEVIEYSSPVPCCFERETKIERKEQNTEEIQKREDNLYRARKNIRHIIWSNQTKYTKFVTLTYAETVLDTKKVQRDITTFVQSMRRMDYDMKYLYVLENQRARGEKEGNDGCLHVHMLIFLDKYIKLEDLNKAWKHGQTDIQVIDDIQNLGAYVCKYITKDNMAKYGKRTYACSKGLKRPTEERFYTVGCSDSYYGELSPEDVLNAIDVKYKATKRHDYISPTDGSGQCQTIRYIQGQWKDKNIFKDNDPLYDLKRQIDNLHLSEDLPDRKK